MSEVLEQLRAERVIAVLRARTPEELLEVATALREGGIRSLEFTMTTPGALEMLRTVTDTLGKEVLLGAGTVMDARTAEQAIAAGAQFLVSPCLKTEVIEVGKAHGIPTMPGAFTPGEVYDAWEAGADVVKVFPAGRLGPEYLKDLHGPFPDIPLMPTGGISTETAVDYLKAGAVAVGLGGNLTRRGPGETVADLSERASRLMIQIRALG